MQTKQKRRPLWPPFSRVRNCAQGVVVPVGAGVVAAGDGAGVIT